MKDSFKALDKELDIEELKRIIYTIFCVIIFALPVVKEIYNTALYSLKCSIFNFATIITLVVLMIISIKERKIKPNKYDTLFIIYGLIVTLSTLFTKYGIIDSILGNNGRGEGLLTICCYISTAVIFSKGFKYIKGLLKIAFFAAIIIAIYGIIQANVPLSVKLPFNVTSNYGTAEGTFGNRNFLSSYLCMFLPSLSYYYLKSGKKYTLIGIALLFAAFVYAKTLSGYLTLTFLELVIILLYIVLSKNKKEAILKSIVLIVTLVAVVSVIILINGGDNYFKEITQMKTEISNIEDKNEDTGTGRRAIWKRTLMVVKNNLWFGTGPDNLGVELRNNSEYHLQGSDDILSSYIVDKAHSEPLHILATTGIFSLIIYLVIISLIQFNLMKINIKNFKNKHGDNTFNTIVTISSLAYIIQAMVNISVVQVAPIYWGFLGLCIGIITNNNENNKA